MSVNERNLEMEYSDITHGMLRDSTPGRYRRIIHHLKCNHCGHQIEPDSKLGNFAKISRARKEMREHIRDNH